MKKTILSLLLSLAVLLPAWAFDFSSVAPSGQVLYFNVVDDGVELTHPVEATNPNQMWGSYAKPVGALVLPSSVEWSGVVYNVVGVGDHAFYNCDMLASLTVPEGVTSIGVLAFGRCTDLAEVHLPSTLQSVGNSAFSACDSLRDVWVLAAVPPTASAAIFSSSPVGEGRLHVPFESVALYGAATGWSVFGQVLSDVLSTLTLAPNYPVRGTVTGSGSYPTGTTVAISATPAEGFFLACWSDGDTADCRLVTLTHNLSLTALFFPFRDYDPLLAPHDTVTLFVHDTVAVADTVHDTLMVVDTLVPTFFRLTVASDNAALGLGVGSAVLPAGSEVEVCGLPVEGGRFIVWSDGSAENPRRITLDGDRTLTAHFEQAGTADAVAATWTATADGRWLTVRCTAGERLRVLDVQGRCLAMLVARGPQTTLLMPAAGVYLVQVGDAPARRIAIEQ